MRVRLATVLVLATILALLGALPVSAWYDDAFDNSASGQAVYEDQMIHPQAVHGADGRTYVVYQGANLNPYIVALDSSGNWYGPVRVGVNPLTSQKNFDDTHGAPSLLIDRAGYLHVFYGSHLSHQVHARSGAPFDIWHWVSNQAVPPLAMTYPQPMQDTSGTVSLYHRLDVAWHGYGVGSWMHSVLTSGASQWVTSTAVVAGSPTIEWYAHTQLGANDRTHLVLVAYHRSATTQPFNRYGVFYLYSDGDGVWRDVRGTPLASDDSTYGITYADLTTSTVAASVYVTSAAVAQNQVDVADDGSGHPGILFVNGAGSGPASHAWVFARWGGSSWTTSTIAPTDHLFDSSTLEYVGGGLDAFLTVGGSSDANPSLEPYANRGGDIVQYHSNDDGATWSKEATLAAANRSMGVSYNDPQIVLDHNDEARVLFGEWDNSGTNFFHRVFLWGANGLKQRAFYPSLVRAGGADRYSVSASLSQRDFPVGSHIAVVVSGATFADALSAVPLAVALDAPVLTTSGAALSPATKAELLRLKSDTVVIVGGTGSVTSRVSRDMLSLTKVRHITRIAGSDRYAVAANVAARLRELQGPARTAFVVNGDAWADALSAAPVAAQMRAPVLLARRTGVPRATAAAVRALAASATVVVAGGEGSIASGVERAVGARVRVGGANRYEVSAALARLALDGSATLPGCSTMRRFVVASGETFADALPAGVLAARGRGPLLLSGSSALPPATRTLLDERATRVLMVTLAGGPATLKPSMASDLAALLAGRQAP